MAPDGHQRAPRAQTSKSKQKQKQHQKKKQTRKSKSKGGQLRQSLHRGTSGHHGSGTSGHQTGTGRTAANRDNWAPWNQRAPRLGHQRVPDGHRRTAANRDNGAPGHQRAPRLGIRVQLKTQQSTAKGLRDRTSPTCTLSQHGYDTDAHVSNQHPKTTHADAHGQPRTAT